MLVTNDAETLDPRFATDAVGLRASRLLHAGLVRLDPETLEPKPYMAESWSFVDDLTLRVVLRDVHFHSGAPLRPADVIASIDGFRTSRHARVVEAIGDVRADGDRAVVVHLKHAHATLLTDLELPILRADEAKLPPRPDGTLDGLGPFTVKERLPGAITLKRDKGEDVVLRTVRDENARALRLHAGRADLVLNGFSPTLLPAFDGAPGLTVNARAGANLTYMMMRVDRAPLDDLRLRQAISLAIDRERIARTLFSGRAQPASTLLPPMHWAHTDLPPLPFDPAAAKAMVRGGKKLTLLTSTDRLRGTIARLLSEELAETGVDLEVIPLELGTLLARLSAGDFELATLQLPEITEPNVLRVFLHSTSVPPNGLNRGRISDPDVDRLLDEGDTHLENRKATYAEVERVMRERALLLPLWHEDQVWVSSPRASRFRASAEGRWLSLTDL